MDLERGMVVVRRKLLRGEAGGWAIRDGPKTKAGRRAILLLPTTVAALRAHRNAQVERRLLLGPAWRDLNLVFDRGDGDHERPNTVRGALGRAVKQAGLPKLTPHGVRHTVATLMAAQGVNPRVVQERLGHSSVQTTLAVYSHVSTEMDRAGAERLAQVLDQEPESSVRSA